LDAPPPGVVLLFWPGSLTLYLPRSAPDSHTQLASPGARCTVGIRWADHPVVRALCLAVGPLAVTSANRHGQAPATTAVEVEGGLPDGGWLGAVVDGGVCSGLPSTVVECRGPASRLLREGLIPRDELGRVRG
jgi:tRNA A37 threonylcarbamoyladenosine synthetase subunit TsaC/SUA5/YrdC